MRTLPIDMPTPPSRKKLLLGGLLLGGLLLGGLLAGGWAAWPWLQPAPQHAVVLNTRQPIAEFKLDSTLGHPLSLSQLGEHYTLFYFGYTTCPDICPTTLADLSQAQKLLGEQAQKLQMVFVTVDPERDTVERLRDYLAYFGPGWIGLAGPPAVTANVASQFGVVYQKQPARGSATEYLIDHSSVVVLLDPQHRPLLLFPYGVSGEQIADDLAAAMR